MNAFRSVRARLAVSQAEIGAALGVTQSNVSFYEKGQTVPPDVAAKLIEYARGKGLELSYDQIYGATPLEAAPTPPDAPTSPAPAVQEEPAPQASAAQEHVVNGEGQPRTAIAMGVEQRSRDREIEDLRIERAKQGEKPAAGGRDRTSSARGH
jgi:putative transcriptional regulator